MRVGRALRRNRYVAVDGRQIAGFRGPGRGLIVRRARNMAGNELPVASPWP